MAPKYMIKGRLQDGFGTDANREPLFHRDVSKSPYKNPTSLDGPEPGRYKIASEFCKLNKADEPISAQGLPSHIGVT